MFDFVSVTAKEISSEQIKDVFPVQITLNASLPYTLGKDYSVYFCDGNAAKKQNVIYSDKSKVTFQTSKYGRFTLYAHRNMPLGLKLCVIKVKRHNSFQK